jgi:hypothetical protein
VTEVTSFTFYKTNEGFEIRLDGADVPRGIQRQKVETLRDVVQEVRKVGMEMAPTPPTNVLGPPLPQGEVDELLEAQKRADAVTASNLAPHTADLGQHVAALREARPEFLKRPLPLRCLMVSPVAPPFPLLVCADAESIVLTAGEEHALNRLAVMPALRPPNWGGDPVHLHLDRSKPVEIERDGLSFTRHSVNLRSLFR